MKTNFKGDPIIDYFYKGLSICSNGDIEIQIRQCLDGGFVIQKKIPVTGTHPERLIKAAKRAERWINNRIQ